MTAQEHNDWGRQIDDLKRQMEELKSWVMHTIQEGSVSGPACGITSSRSHRGEGHVCGKKVFSDSGYAELEQKEMEHTEMKTEGTVYYSGFLQTDGARMRFEPRLQHLQGLIGLDGDKAAKILAALGHKQRLDILRSLLQKPMTGPELVELLEMGTTGQLYHHIKALLSAGLLIQEERGGRYAIPSGRMLPLLLLLSGAADLLDAGDYLDMADARDQASIYLGPKSRAAYDPHLLLWAIAENSILEHQGGSCSEMTIILHNDGSATVSDNGRGIPVQLLPDRKKSNAESVLTDIGRMAASAPFTAPGAEKGLSIAVANALSGRLSVEIRREGRIFRQDYRYGIPQSGLMTVGMTKETGTSITFEPNTELFEGGFDRRKLEERAHEVRAAYPKLSIAVVGPSGN